MTLKRLAAKERKEVAQILTEYWAERKMPMYDRRWAESFLREGHSKETAADEFFVYRHDHSVIGVIALITDVSGVAQIRDFVVKDEYRNKGFGKKMLRDLITLGKKQGLRKMFVMCSPKLKSFYRSFGFRKEGLLKSHFAMGENLIIMSLLFKKGRR